MNKAKKKVVEAMAIEDVYTYTLNQAQYYENQILEYKNRLEETMNLDEELRNRYEIEYCNEQIEQYEAQTSASYKLAEQLLKMM